MLTKYEVIDIAKSLVLAEGWSWEEPVKIYNYKKYLFFGKKYWHIITNMHFKGCNVIIKIDDETGEVVFKNFVSM